MVFKLNSESVVSVITCRKLIRYTVIKSVLCQFLCDLSNLPNPLRLGFLCTMGITSALQGFCGLNVNAYKALRLVSEYREAVLK